MRQRSCGNKEGVGWDAGTRESLAQAFAFVPHKVTCSESLFPAPPGASRQTGCWAPRAAHRAPSVLPCGPQPRPGLWVRAEARTQAGLPDTHFRCPALLPAQFRPGLLHLQPPGLPTTSFSSLRTPLAPPPVPGPAGGRDAFPSVSSRCAPVRCPPGAAPAPGPSPQQAAASPVLPAPPRSRADTV